MSFEEKFEKRQRFLSSFFHPTRILLEGSRDMLKMWVEAVETGKLQASPSEVEKTRARIKEYEEVLVGPLPPQNIRDN